MKKVSVTLPDANGGKWGSIKTKYPKDSAQVRFVDFTGTSKNFDTDANGVITKRSGGINFNGSTFTGNPKDAYEAIFANGTRYLLTMANGTLKYSTGGGSFSDITAGYSTSGNMEFASYQDRVYFGNGIDTDQTLDKTTTYGGVTYTAPKTKAMGCLVPSAPSAVLVLTGVGNVPAGGHTYKVTYLYYDAEESNGSTASGVVTNDGANKQTTVTIPVGGYGVTARKIYRDNNDGNWLLLATVANNTATTYTDNIATGTSTVPTDNGLPPNGAYFLQYLDRIWIAGVSASGSYIYFSEPGLPDIFGSTNYVLCNPRDPIIGMVEYSGKILVFNRNSMGWILGKTKDQFRYEQIPSSVGCVDNRSIQVRTNTGVPTVIWLSSKGLYEFNGGSINYISEDIQDQLNVNVQQASQVKGKNTQDTTSDFQAGTASAGIVVSGGSVTQANPKRAWDDQTDWEGGSSLSNVDTKNNANVLQVPTAVSPTIASGTHSNTIESAGSVTLTSTSDFTGESHTGVTYVNANSPSNPFGSRRAAQKFIPTRSGTLTAATFYFQARNSSTRTWSFKVWNNAGGVPGSVISSGSFSVAVSSPTYVSYSPTIALSASLTAGQTYWIGIETAGTPDDENVKWGYHSTNDWSYSDYFYIDGGPTAATGFNSLWQPAEFTTSSARLGSLAGSYTFSSSAIAASGQWTSQTDDTGSTGITTSLTLSHTGTYPTNTSAITYLEGSNDNSTFDVSYPTANLNGSAVISVSARRYWRIRMTLNTTDNRAVPTLGAPTLKFGTTGIWISEVVDHTTDITALNSLVTVSNAPAGTSVTVEIATSTDNISYSAYSAVGAATPHRYSKVKVTMTTTGDNVTTPTVTSITLKWTVVSTLTSQEINTGATPVGWELFTAVVGSGGTVTFQTKSAATSGGLGAAVLTAVTSGTYIPSAANPYLQWKATLTATADNVPSIDSVVVNWFISQTQSIRVASVFDGLAYYLAAAEYGNTTNNIVFKYDADKNFRVYRGVSINCLTYFFNDIYFGSSVEGRFVKWLTGLTDSGTNIEMDVQSAAINYSDQEHNKILRKVYVTGKNTGATYTPQYSTDEGTTWKSMVNPLTGLTTFVTTSALTPFKVRFEPIFSADNATGTSHIFRLVSNDAYQCEIRTVKLEAWIRLGEPR